MLFSDIIAGILLLTTSAYVAKTYCMHLLKHCAFLHVSIVLFYTYFHISELKNTVAKLQIKLKPFLDTSVHLHL